MTNEISNKDEFPNFTNDLKTNQQTEKSFKTEFYVLAKYIGGNVDKLHEYLGKYDEIQEDEHRAYIWFKNNKTSFYVGNDKIVGRLQAPLADASGHDINTNDDVSYFNIDGVIPGMHINKARELWGLLDNKDLLPLTHKENGTTFSGETFLVGAAVDGDSPDYRVSSFVARIIRNEPNVTVKPKSGCFIATACYGDYEAREVTVLREFRDNVLLKSNLGTRVIKVYYFISPTIARMILKSSILKKFIRNYFLDPIVSKISKR